MDPPLKGLTIILLYFAQFARVNHKVRLNLYMDDAQETWIMEITREGVYATLDYSRSKTRMYKAIQSARARKTKGKLGKLFCKNLQGFRDCSWATHYMSFHVKAHQMRLSLAPHFRRAQWRMSKYGRSLQTLRAYLTDRKVNLRGWRSAWMCKLNRN